MGKARVVPIKYITISRMELVASTVSVKISPLIQKELQLLSIKKTFSTGSEVGLKLKLIHPK